MSTLSRLAFATDALLQRHARSRSHARPRAELSYIPTSGGIVRVRTGGESGSPVLVLAPDGPCVIEHFDALLARLDQTYRTVCIDLPGFGLSVPHRSYDHTFGAAVRVLEECLDALRIERCTLSFTCVNGFYALAFASRHPERVTRVVLGQTPSLDAMNAWVERIVPRPIAVPIAGQLVNRVLRRELTRRWFGMALPKTTSLAPWIAVARQNQARGGCFCFASVVQGVTGSNPEPLYGVKAPTVLLWGEQDRSHRRTSPESLLELVPHARIVRLPACGHFPNLEDPDAFVAALQGTEA